MSMWTLSRTAKKESKFIVKVCEIKDFGQHLKGMFTKPKDLQLSKAVVIKYKHSERVEVHQNYAQMTPTSFTILKKIILLVHCTVHQSLNDPP